MTENIFSTLNISKLCLKENVNSRELLKQEETNLLNKAVDNLVNDIKTKSYNITVTPQWKDTNMIDFKKVDHLLNTEEVWK